MKKLMIVFCALPLFLSAQDKIEESKFGIKFSGFVKTDIFYDTRQTVNIREGHFALYPDNILKDANGDDINATPQFNILSIQSRLKGDIKGPDAFGAKTSGLLEADFFGNANANFDDVNGFRLRHAFVKLSWQKSELLVGQFWHPMFVTDVFPEVISFNTGAPFQPFSRNPQIRYTYKQGGLNIMAVAFTQRDFQGIGPAPTTFSPALNTTYLRNSGKPEGHIQIQYKPDSTEHVFGAGVSYKTIVPEIYRTNASNQKYITNKTLGSMSAFAYLKLKLKPVTVKLEGVYAQNAYDMTMIGGYAVQEIVDPVTNSKIFANLTTASVWTEVLSNTKKVKVGGFIGFTKNMGASDSITSSIFARSANIDYIYRIAPRLVFVSGKLNIAVEEEFTYAMYGKMNGNGEGMVTNGVPTQNFRTVLAFIYNF